MSELLQWPGEYLAGIANLLEQALPAAHFCCRRVAGSEEPGASRRTVPLPRTRTTMASLPFRGIGPRFLLPCTYTLQHVVAVGDCWCQPDVAAAGMTCRLHARGAPIANDKVPVSVDGERGQWPYILRDVAHAATHRAPKCLAAFRLAAA